MSKRRSLESIIVKFFYEAPLDVAESILAVCKDAVAVRRPTATKKRGKRRSGAIAGGSGERTKPTNGLIDLDDVTEDQGGEQ